MFLLPYVYGAWMKLTGLSWYGTRLLSAFLAIGLGLLLYRHVARLTGRPRYGLLAVFLFSTSSLAIGWYSVVKTLPLTTLAVFAAYVALSEVSSRWRYTVAGLLLGLAIDVRLYAIVLVPAFAVHAMIHHATPRDRWLQLARFGVGLLVALLPNEFFLLVDPDAFYFNIVGMHTIRSDFGAFGAVDQKLDIALRMLGINATEGVTAFQFTILAFLNVSFLVSKALARQRCAFSAWLAIILAVVSLLPTPTYTQYFCIPLPFLIVNAVLFIAWLREGGSPAGGMDGREHRWLHAPATHALAVVVGAYMAAAPLDVYRYAVSGMDVPGVFSSDRAANWRIATIREIGRAIDQEIRPEHPVVISWWPGYFLETRATILPRMENHFELQLSSRLEPSQWSRYNVMSYPELLATIARHEVDVIVLGNWIPDAHKPFYRDFLVQKGYVAIRRIAGAEIYRWKGPRPQ